MDKTNKNDANTYNQKEKKTEISQVQNKEIELGEFVTHKTIEGKRKEVNNLPQNSG